MQDKYIKGHVCAQDEEGMPGHLYRVTWDNDQKHWLFIDESEADGAHQWWHFGEDKKLIDGGEFECNSSLTEDILHEACEWADIPDDEIEELEDDYLSVSDLEGEFTGM